MRRSKEDMERLVPILRESIHYEPDTGLFTWKSSQRAGHPAFQCENNGYLRGQIAGYTLPAHRAAWLMHFGEWPDSDLDHIDGDRQNNAITNLRVTDRVNNNRNRKLPVTNKTGVIGVAWRPERKSWRAQISVEGRNVYLGYFDTLEKAVAARRAAEKALGYHENHGRAA